MTTYFPTLVRGFRGAALDHNSAHCINGCRGAALWLPPGVHSDETALATLFQKTVDETKRRDLLDAFDQIGTFHPAKRHWYLPLIGVDPAQ